MNETQNLLSFRNLTKLIEDYSPKNYSIILAIPIVFLGMGFLIWSVYLYTFGFTGNELFQSQYIITGVVFLLISLVILGVVTTLIDIINWIAKKIPSYFIPTKLDKYVREKMKIPLYIFVILSWFLFYISQLFPLIPYTIGGGQPRVLSLITTNENMKTLNSLQIAIGDGATYQTENVCVVYQDSKQIYILRRERVLAINQSLIEGFGSLPGPNSVLGQECVALASFWSNQGLYFSRILLINNIGNIFRRLAGKPQIYFEIISTQPLHK